MSTEGQVSRSRREPNGAEADYHKVITCKAAVAWEAGEYGSTSITRSPGTDVDSQAPCHRRCRGISSQEGRGAHQDLIVRCISQ